MLQGMQVDLLQQEVPDRRLDDTQEGLQRPLIGEDPSASSGYHSAGLPQVREYTWDAHLRDIQVENDDILTYDNPPPSDAPLFPQIPHHVIDDDSVKAAVLCYLTCNEPFVHLELLFTQLLQGMYTLPLRPRSRANHRRVRYQHRGRQSQTKVCSPQDDRNLLARQRHQLAALCPRCFAHHLNQDRQIVVS